MLDVATDRNRYNFQTEVRVRLSETDAVGIVFFGSFSTFLDVGRMDYLNHLGLTSEEVTGAGPTANLPPGAVRSAALEFHAPARYNDVLLIQVRVAELGRSSYTFHFLIEHKRDRRLVATGRTTLIWLDDDFRPMSIPEPFRARIRVFEGANLAERDAPAASASV